MNIMFVYTGFCSRPKCQTETFHRIRWYCTSLTCSSVDFFCVCLASTLLHFARSIILVFSFSALFGLMFLQCKQINIEPMAWWKSTRVFVYWWNQVKTQKIRWKILRITPETMLHTHSSTHTHTNTSWMDVFNFMSLFWVNI